MKQLAIMGVFLSVCYSIYACKTKRTDNPSTDKTELKMDSTQLKIRVNGMVFQATIFDNPTSQAFLKMLPLTIDMIELHGNEKYYNPKNDEKLPCENSKSGTIQAGDLMVWDASQRSLVLFYKTFDSPYKYVRIAHINDSDKLAQTLGDGNVTVKFELE